MLNFRKRLEEIEEKKKKELEFLQEKLNEFLEEVYEVLDKTSYREFSRINVIEFNISPNKEFLVKTEQNNTILTKTFVEDLDLVQMLNILEDNLTDEKFYCDRCGRFDLIVHIKDKK